MKKFIKILMLIFIVNIVAAGCTLVVRPPKKVVKVQVKSNNGVHKGELKKEKSDND